MFTSILNIQFSLSRKLFLLVIFVTAFVKSAMAQNPQTDFQLRLGFELEAPINKRFLLHYQHQSRFIDNATRYNYSYNYIGGVYKISRNMRFTANYIFVNKKNTELTYSFRHQFKGYFTYRKKLGEFMIFNRLMGDVQFKDFYGNPQGKHLRDINIRNKITLRYKHFEKFVPYIAEETYYRFDGKYYEKGFGRNRMFIGALYNITENWLADASFAIDLRRDNKIPANNFYLSLGLVKTFFQ